MSAYELNKMNKIVTESDNHEFFREWSEEVSERYALASLRVMELANEKLPAFFPDGLAEYFQSTAVFIKNVLCELCGPLTEDGTDMAASKDGAKKKVSAPKRLEELFYQDLEPEFYRESFANPDYCEKKLGRECAAIAACVYTEVRAMIRFACEGNKEALTILMEFFLEVFCMSESVLEDSSYDALRLSKIMQESLYYYVFDYCEYFTEDLMKQKLGLSKRLFDHLYREEFCNLANRLPIWACEYQENPDYEADHSCDLGLIFDHAIRERILVAYQNAFEKYALLAGELRFKESWDLEENEKIPARTRPKKASASYFNARQERQIYSLCEKIRKLVP